MQDNNMKPTNDVIGLITAFVYFHFAELAETHP